MMSDKEDDDWGRGQTWTGWTEGNLRAVNVKFS